MTNRAVCSFFAWLEQHGIGGLAAPRARRRTSAVVSPPLLRAVIATTSFENVSVRLTPFVRQPEPRL